MLTETQIITLRYRIKYQFHSNDYLRKLIQQDTKGALNSLTIWMVNTVASKHADEAAEIVKECFYTYLMEELLNAS